MTDIAQLGFSVSTGELEKGEAALNAMVPAAERASRASVALARADLDRAKASAAAVRATEGATQADIQAANMAVKKAAAVLADSQAELSRANAVNMAAAGTTKLTGAVSAAAAGATKQASAAQAAAAGITAQGDAAVAASGKLARLGAVANDNISKMQSTPSNIAAQFQDIGVTAAAGMNPMLIALQQGTQLSAAFAGGMGGIAEALKQIFSPLALITIGVVGLIAYLIQMVDWTKVAKAALNGLADIIQAAAPYLALFAAGLALIYAPTIIAGIWSLAQAFYGLAAGILASIGLPVLLLAGLVAVVAAANIFRDKLTKYFGFDIVGAAAKGVNIIIGLFVGGFNSIVAIWKQLPQVIGDFVFTTANWVLDGISKQVNGVIEMINKLLNMLPFGVGNGMNIDWRANFQINNPFAGSAAGLARTVGSEMSSAQGVDYVGKAMGYVKSGADYLANKLRGLANGMGAGKDGKGGSANDRESGGKTDAEKFSDIVRGAENDIAKENARANAIELTAEAAAKLEFQTKLLNEARTKEIALTEPMIAKINELADAYSKAKVAADNAVGLRDVLKASDARNADIQSQIDLIGKYGHELAYATEMAKLLSDAKAKGMTPSAITAAKPIFERKAEIAAVKADQLALSKFMEEAIQKAEMETFAFERQRGEIGLVKGELAAYRYETDLLTKAKRDHVVLTELELKAIHDSAVAYGNASEALRKMTVLEDLGKSLDLSDAFGNTGKAIDEMTKAVERLTDAQEAHKAMVAEAGDDQEKRQKADILYNQAKLNGTIALIGAAKHLFAENSAGYKAMEAAERVMAAIQAVNTVKSIAAGAAKIFSQLGVFAFPVIGAMLGVMSQWGFSGHNEPSAKDLQAAQGTGSVLGDSSAKSSSIGNSLDLMLKNSNRDLEYSNAMVKSLRAIEGNIGNLSSLLARQLGLSNGIFSTDKLNLGTTTSTPFGLGGIPLLGGLIGALFGTTTTRTLFDQGLNFKPTTVAQIIDGGIQGNTYQDVEVEKKKKFLGITVGGSKKIETTTGTLDAELTSQINLLVGSLRSSIISAAGVLGIEGAQATLDAFEVNIGKISLMGLKGDEIQKALEGVFGKLGDDMARAAIPGIEAFQKVGEGLFETLMRLAKDYTTVDVTLLSIGRTFGAVGASSVAARESLIALFGSLDEFVSQTDFFRENFLTEAEQLAPVIVSVTAEMDRLGLSGVTTKDQFKAVINSLDLTTVAGQELYASLLAVAPGFAKVADAATKAAEDQAAAAAKIAAERRSLTIDLLDAMGKSREAELMRREDAIAAVDVSNRPLLVAKYAWLDLADAITAANDKVAAANDKVANAKDALTNAYSREVSALEQDASKWRSISESLRSFRDSLTSNPNGSPSYGQATIDYLRVSGGAIAGSERDAAMFQSTAQTYLAASLNSARSSIEYRRDVARVRNDLDKAINGADGRVSMAESQLAQLKDTVSKLVKIDEDTLTVAAAIKALDAAQAEAAAAQAERDALTNPVPSMEVLISSSSAIEAGLAEISGELSETRSDQVDLLTQMADRLTKVEEFTKRAANSLDRIEGSGVPVRTIGSDVVKTVAG